MKENLLLIGLFVVLTLSAPQSTFTLFSGAMDAGSHNVRFDAGDLTSGVYLARLSVEGSRRQIEMILE